MSKRFDQEILDQLALVEKVRIETRSTPEGPIHMATIWVSADLVEGNVYVRPLGGTGTRWYKEITANPIATLHIPGQRLQVRAIPVTDDQSIKAANYGYIRKYDYLDPSSTRSITRDENFMMTLRLEPI